MAKILIDQTSFTSGELSPKLQGRTDSANYKAGLEKATNAFVNVQGSISRRNGFEYIAKTKTSSANTKLIKFQYNQDTAYILEFGNLYIRMFSPDGQKKETAKVITGITKANPAVVTTSGSHGYTTGDQVYLESIIEMTELNNSEIPYTITVISPTTFSLNSINSTAYTAYGSGGTSTKIYEIVSPYTDAQVPDIQYVQNGATMYIVHPSVTPQLLVLNSDLTWTINSVNFNPLPTVESGFTPAVTLTPSAVTGANISFTVSSSTFLAGDIGRQIVNLTGTGKALITSLTSATVAVANITEDFPSTAVISSGNWKLDLSPISDLSFTNRLLGQIVTVTSTTTVTNSNVYETPISITSIAYSNGINVANTGSTWDITVTTSGAHSYSNGNTVTIESATNPYDPYYSLTLNGTGTVSAVTANTFVLVGQAKGGYNVFTGAITAPTAYAGGGVSIKYTADSDSGEFGNSVFRSTDVGSYILAHNGIIKITVFYSASAVGGTVVKTLTALTATANWTLEQPSWTSTRGYPRTVGLVQDRLVLAGTTAQPQTLWLSEIGAYSTFGAGADDADSIEITLTSNQVNELNWIATSRDLIVGTSGSELSIDSGSNSGITPSSIRQVPRTFRGSKRQQPLLIGTEIVYLEGATRKIRTFRYDFQLDGYTGENVIMGSDHLSDDGLVELAYIRDPESMILAITETGDLLAGSYNREMQVMGWTKQEGYGDFTRVQTITNGNDDQIWVIVKRLIGSGNTYNIERLVISDGESDTDSFSDSFSTFSVPVAITSLTTGATTTIVSATHSLTTGDSIILKDIEDVSFNDLDPDKTNVSTLNGTIHTVTVTNSTTFTIAVNTTDYNGAALSVGNVFKRVSTVSNLHHLEGKTVQVKGDGAVQPAKVVSSGLITLDYAAGEVVVGLAYQTEIKTLSIEFNIGLGSMQGQLSRWARPLLRVHKSTVPLLNGEYLPSRNAGNNLGNKVPLFTGILEYGNLTWDKTSALTITVDDPLPLKLLSINGAVDAGVK